jgi:Arc/MetJ-type ribon-helix-helix transcriptional regulator
MSIQISVRLPDSLVHSLDELVTSGDARSRASVVEAALERHLRQVLAERDAAILAATTDGTDDLDGLAPWATRQPLNLP